MLRGGTFIAKTLEKDLFQMTSPASQFRLLVSNHIFLVLEAVSWVTGAFCHVRRDASDLRPRAEATSGEAARTDLTETGNRAGSFWHPR